MRCYLCGKVVHGHGRYHRLKLHSFSIPERKKVKPEKPVILYEKPENPVKKLFRNLKLRYGWT